MATTRKEVRWGQCRFGDGGKAAYKALLIGGGSGFNALLGGGRGEGGQYARLEAHGFYWTARRKLNRAAHVSTTSAKAGWLSIVKAVARKESIFRSVCQGVTDFSPGAPSCLERGKFCNTTKCKGLCSDRAVNVICGPAAYERLERISRF
jgi:hypothetical protein